MVVERPLVGGAILLFEKRREYAFESGGVKWTSGGRPFDYPGAQWQRTPLPKGMGP